MKLDEDKITHIRYRGFLVILIYQYKLNGGIYEINPLLTLNDSVFSWFDPMDINSWYRPYEIGLMISHIRCAIDSYLVDDGAIPF